MPRCFQLLLLLCVCAVQLSCLLCTAGVSFAQPVKLRPAPADTATLRCDTSLPWKLVFSDDFDGHEADRNKWHTYGNWAGMESDNWEESRTTKTSLAINRDENVVVAGGICTLQLKREDGTWKCDTCGGAALSKQYTSGELFSYYTRAFSRGRFEARIKMPVVDGTHATFWLWPSESNADAPEFDIAEGYGGRFWPTPFPQQNGRFTNFSIHRWGPSGHKESLNRFPKQHYSNVLRNNYFDQSQWHVYACEWEADFVKIFLDGALVKVFSKYYYRNFLGIKIKARCNTRSKRLRRYFFFPPETAGCNVRLTLALDKDNNLPAGLLAEMMVDYVRVWQREPSR